MQIKLKPINEQVVVVFGASSGIGRQAALDFAERGAKVVVAARSENGLKSLVEEIESKGGEAYYLIADAADFSQVKNVADSTIEKFGRLDTWVHSAGTFIFAKVEQTEPEEYKRLIEVNLLGQIYGAKAALPYLKKSGGALIHISSVEAWRTVPFQSAYGASKHGIGGFVQALRAELAHDERRHVGEEFAGLAVEDVRAEPDKFRFAHPLAQNCIAEIELVIAERGVVESGRVPGGDHLPAFEDV